MNQSAPETMFIDVGIKLHVHAWPGDKPPFVLLHGLASNKRTWAGVAAHLSAAGHRVLAVDQRGHGLSDKPDTGYDFATITADLARLLEVANVTAPIIAGQSWGGNVVLDFGAHYPDLAQGLVFVDGGFLNLRTRPGATWAAIAESLKPPNLVGTPREQIKGYLTQTHADWPTEGIESALANFETLPDGTVRPWLTLERHMQILRAMWNQHPDQLFQQVAAPVLMVPARDIGNPEWTAQKQQQVVAAEQGLRRVTTHWMDADHDIHIQYPAQLAELMHTWAYQTVTT